MEVLSAAEKLIARRAEPCVCSCVPVEIKSRKEFSSLGGMFPLKKRPSDSHRWLISENDPEEELGRSEPPQKCCLRIVLVVMTIVTVVLTSIALAILIAASISDNQSWEEEMVEIMAELKAMHFDNTVQILATNSSATVILRATSTVTTTIKLTFGQDVGHLQDAAPVSCLEQAGDVLTCLSWNDTARLTVAEFPIASSSARCMNVTLHASQATACFNFEGRHIFGGPELSTQKWPAEGNRAYVRVPYLSGYDGIKGVVERYWLTSLGEMVFVPSHVPLFWTTNGTEMCFTSSFEPPYYKSADEEEKLDLVVCAAEDTPMVHKAVANVFLGKPEAPLDENMIRVPIWSTWAKYKANISQLSVVDYAMQIVENGFPASQIEIDDKWETCYGEARFDNESFPDPKEMVNQIHDLGFRVTLWTHPFVNTNCPSFTDDAIQNILVQDANGNASKVTWWDGDAGLIDFTNPNAVDLFLVRLLLLKENFLIDGFKFDAGDMSYVPANGSLHSIRGQPAAFTKAYAEAAVRIDDHLQHLSEMRTAFGMQRLALAVRMSDKGSTWDDENGLAALIPTLLTFNLVGYSNVMPDMIGGNGYDNVLPDKELFIRWMQAVTFMPIMQFSIPPWDFDQETVEIAKECVELHVKLADSFYALARQRAVAGIPINLPVWWIAPHDSIAQTIDSEFLLGENILVAPVLEKGATSRDIYLPAGVWREGFGDDESRPIHEGPVWLRNFSAPLRHLPFFQRATTLVK
ncbi:myogenesis-regulating glycosidase-like [Neocloeon triangulifer]|uniref:myogenesis-regulating glycosidase-like n=1 Tax=Neocloeon triangulifer TaxID=2078957 RepID=UPI00286F5F8F|nr:myogenesis-regulating glycosidase-like [Neocloeon triangulifer]